jgi:hypothetical protein
VTAAAPPKRPPLDHAVFGMDEALCELESQVYGHVLDAIDFDALNGLEQQLYCLLTDRELDEDVALDLSKLVISRALERAADDPARYVRFGPPDGVTEAEAKAVAFDETCPFCVAEADAEERAKARAAEDGQAGGAHGHGANEPCPLCDDLVRRWRAEHADTLRKRGVGPPAG